jgi:hypothetical protein
VAVPTDRVAAGPARRAAPLTLDMARTAAHDGSADDGGGAAGGIGAEPREVESLDDAVALARHCGSSKMSGVMDPDAEALTVAGAYALLGHLNAAWAELVHAHNRVLAASGFMLAPALTGVVMLHQVVTCLDCSLRLAPDRARKLSLSAFKSKHKDLRDLRGLLTHIEEYHRGIGQHVVGQNAPSRTAAVHGAAFMLVQVAGSGWQVSVGGGAVHPGTTREWHPRRFLVDVGAAVVALQGQVEEHTQALQRLTIRHS